MIQLPSKLTSIEMQQTISLVGNIQRLSVKSFNAKNLQNLIFIILNDTYQIIKYDRAILFDKIAGQVNILGISGQATFKLQTEMSARLREAVQKLADSTSQRVLVTGDFSACPEQWDYFQSLRPTTVYWIPFTVKNEELGLWLEKYDDPDAKKKFEVNTHLLQQLLVPAYVAAWEKMSKRFSLRKIMPHIKMRNVGLVSLGVLILLFIIPIRLRVVAPCEVVANKPYVVTAPMEGIINHVAVLPGEEVNKGQLLFKYDKRIPLFRYQEAQTDVGFLQAELNRAYTLGTQDEAESSKLAKLSLELNSSKSILAYAKRQLKSLTIHSPLNGLVRIDDPDNWRGKPVKIGEKIMTINNPKQTKLKIWIPEKNLIAFAQEVPIRAFFDPIPEKTFKAKLKFITPEVKVSAEHGPSCEAEAEWLNSEKSPKIGLNGYAIIYGERVSLFYYLMRKPLSLIMKFFS